MPGNGGGPNVQWVIGLLFIPALIAIIYISVRAISQAEFDKLDIKALA